MLGNRTISGHEITDDQCVKTIPPPLAVHHVERGDANVTYSNGT